MDLNPNSKPNTFPVIAESINDDLFLLSYFLFLFYGSFLLFDRASDPLSHTEKNIVYY